MTRRPHSLRNRVLMAIVVAVLATSLLFSLAAFAIAYSAEDRLFERALNEEIAHQSAAWTRSGALAAPANPDVSIHRSGETLPQDLRRQIAVNPEQSEFYGGGGRHYHIEQFDLNAGRAGAAPAPAIAVTEVSRDLLVRPFRDTIIQFLGWMGLIITIFTAGLAWWLANRAMKPLSALASDVSGAQSTIPVVNAAAYPANEIGMLAHALEQAFARIRGFVDREQAFTRDASHELRTPLAVIRGASDVIALQRNLPPALVEPLRRIDAATTDIALALDQLLALARESRGVSSERVELRPMVEKAIAWSAVRHPASAIRIECLVDANATATAHPTSLQLVLNNLIGNCFQHVKAGTVVIAFDDGILSIADDGPGLDTDVAMLTPFAHGNDGARSGLGLDICRRLCEAATIKLEVDRSRSEQGTTFRLDLRTA